MQTHHIVVWTLSLTTISVTALGIPQPYTHISTLTSSPPLQVLRHAPYLVPFADRARLFQQIVGKEREVWGQLYGVEGGGWGGEEVERGWRGGG